MKFLPVFILLCSVAWAQNAAAQSNIWLYRSGINKVQVINPDFHSITVEVEGLQTLVVPAFGFKTISFRLDDNNVEKRLFHTRYDHASFAQDSLLCSNMMITPDTKKENQAEIIGMAELLFKENRRFEEFLRLLKGMSPLLGIQAAEMDELVISLSRVYTSEYDSHEKQARMITLLREYFSKSGEIRKEDMGCIEYARNRLSSIQPTSFYASRFFNRREKAGFEVSLMSMVGFKARFFRLNDNKLSVTPVSFRQQPAYGIRVNYRFNAYDAYKNRNTGIQSYIPVTYLQSRAVYKKVPDSVFLTNQTYQWNFISIGYGQELNSNDGSGVTGKFSLLMDAGFVTSILSTGLRDSSSGSINSRERVSALKGIVPYINIGCKYRVLHWLEVYGAYYSTFLYRAYVLNKIDMPAFRQFNLGLNFVLSRKISYQY